MLKTKVKLAVAQISTDPGNIPANTEKIIDYINKAKESGVNIVIFPELAIPGYMSLDLMLYENYIKENLEGLKQIAKSTNGILVIVGFIDQDREKIGSDGSLARYNSAAIIHNQKIISIQDKTLLPDYDVFFENRYFSKGRGRKLVEFEGLKIGVEICEDLWDENYEVKVSEDLINMGADLLINISGSPFYIGKRFDREELIARVSKNYNIPFVYVNTVGVQDGYDGELVFDGQSMVFDKKGNLSYLGKQFEEELFFIDLENLMNSSNKSNLPEYNPMGELCDGLTLAIKDYFRRTNFNKAFIGLSGGIDSAVVASLVSRALGKENVVGIYMPSHFSSSVSAEEAKKMADNLGIDFEIIPINNIFDNFLETLKKNFAGMSLDVTEENLQARIRGMILMAHANKFKGLVVSTANKTETALGYTTLYGDMCGAIAPIADVSKLKVYELAEYINKEEEVIPQTTIERIPTAELRADQTDEASLGGSYEQISPLVDEIIEDGKSPDELSKKYPKELIDKIFKLINISEYKRRQAAPGVKVTKKAFGLGRRIPIAHGYKG